MITMIVPLRIRMNDRRVILESSSSYLGRIWISCPPRIHKTSS